MEVLIYFEVQTVTPDPRQYNQQRQVYQPVVGCNRVAVPLELNPENFVNVSDWQEKHLLWELGTEGAEKPEILAELICTPLGWSRVMEQLENPYQTPHDEPITAFDGEPTDF